MVVRTRLMLRYTYIACCYSVFLDKRLSVRTNGVEFKLITSIAIKVTVFWDVTPCILIVCRRYLERNLMSVLWFLWQVRPKYPHLPSQNSCKLVAKVNFSEKSVCINHRILTLIKQVAGLPETSLYVLHRKANLTFRLPLNKDRRTWCHLFYYFTIYCSTCFEC